MLRRTKFYLIALIILAYTLIPFSGIIDWIIYGQYVVFLIVNLWEASLFVAGVLAGVYFMRIDEQRRMVNAKKS